MLVQEWIYDALTPPYPPAAAGFGAVDATTPWLQAATGPGGSTYYRVLPTHQVAIGLSLNNYNVSAKFTAGTPDALITRIEAQRVAGARAGDLATTVEALRKGRGIIVVGDPLVDPSIKVVLLNQLPPAAGPFWFVLADPDGGWQPGIATVATERITHELKRAAVGLRWGAIIGAVVGLGIIGAVAAARRK